MTSADNAPIDHASFSYDPFDPAVMANPLPFYRYLRQHHPVYYIEKYDMYCLSRFDDVIEFLSTVDNTYVASETPLASKAVLEVHNSGPVPHASTTPLALSAMHGSPVYEDLRHTYNHPFRPGSVKKLADMIRENTINRLDELLPLGAFDLTRDYAGVVAAQTMCWLFRIPIEEAEGVLDRVNHGSLTYGDGFEAGSVMQRLINLTMPSVIARREEGADGSWPLVDGLLRFQIDGRPLTDAEIAETLGVVLGGGTETVPKIAAHGLWELLKHPDQLAAVRADLETNVPRAVEEMIRFCAPAQWFMRTVDKPTVLAGQELRPGQRVAYLVASAGRDESEYGEDSEEFRWDRPIKRLISFGHGQHFCVGIHLARLELNIIVEEFLRRVPDYEIVEAEAERPPSNFQWGWNRLPVRISG